MSKHLSREDFLEFLDVILEEGPLVKYQNPDAWGTAVTPNILSDCM